MTERDARVRVGLLYGVAAYGIWGVIPLYFRAVNVVPPFELLTHRIVWSAVLLAAILSCTGRWPAFLRAVATRSLVKRLLLSTLFIACNWYVFIYSVVTQQTVQGSLGYFMLPLVNVAFGMLFLGERLRPLQYLAVALAAVGVLVLVALSGVFPWISLTLAFSFTFYGVLRKTTPIDPLVGLSIETLLLSLPGLGFILFWAGRRELTFGAHGPGMDLLIVFSGVMTTVPLICYGQAVQRLKLITVGFLQYISPTIAFLVAVLHFGEPFTAPQAVSFGFIWLALVVFTADAVRATARPGPPPEKLDANPEDLGLQLPARDVNPA